MTKLYILQLAHTNNKWNSQHCWEFQLLSHMENN